MLSFVSLSLQLDAGTAGNKEFAQYVWMNIMDKTNHDDRPSRLVLVALKKVLSATDCSPFDSGTTREYGIRTVCLDEH